MLFASLKKNIGRKLLLGILVTSGFITLFGTSLQLYLDYERDIDFLEKEIHTLFKSFQKQLSLSLWNADTKQVKSIIEGIVTYETIKYVEVVGELDNEYNSFGEKIIKEKIDFKFPIFYDYEGEEKKIGDILIVATTSKVKERLYDRVFFVFLVQFCKTFLVSFVILFLVRNLITNHLSAMNFFFSNFSIQAGKKPDALKLNKPDVGDELDYLKDSINELVFTVYDSYTTLDELAKNLELEIEERTNDLQELNKNLSATLVENQYINHVIWHDLDSMMSSGKKYSKGNINDFKERLVSTLDNSLNLIKIIRKLILDKSGVVKLPLERLELDRLVKDAIDIHEAQAKEKKISISKEIDKNLTVNVEKSTFLGSVLNNIISNAIKYSFPNGVIKIQASQEGKVVTLKVKDFGVGMSSEKLSKIFSIDSGQIEKLRTTGTVGELGHGIGMPLVKKFVNIYGGDIVIKSQESKSATTNDPGTEVIITLSS